MLFFVPYIRGFKTTGCQFVIREEADRIKAINLLDQNMNTLYQYSTKDTLQYGHKKFFIEETGHQDEYVMAISCQLKRRIYMQSSDIAGKVHAVFDNSEVYWLTTKVIRKLLSMQTANFSDCMWD